MGSQPSGDAITWCSQSTLRCMYWYSFSLTMGPSQWQ